MNDFERTYQIDPSREKKFAIESPSIELTDLERLNNAVTRTNDPFPIILNLDPPIISKSPKVRVKNERNKSKIPKKKTAKNDSRANKAAVESLQEKL